MFVGNRNGVSGCTERQSKPIEFGLTDTEAFLEKEGFGKDTPLRRWNPSTQSYSDPFEAKKLVYDGKYRAGAKSGEDCYIARRTVQFYTEQI